jgi:hypothetical protein
MRGFESFLPCQIFLIPGARGSLSEGTPGLM